jgi:hypothetical protein
LDNRGTYAKGQAERNSSNPVEKPVDSDEVNKLLLHKNISLAEGAVRAYLHKINGGSIVESGILIDNSLFRILLLPISRSRFI